MKKLFLAGVVIAGVAVVLSMPKTRAVMQKYVDDFTYNYREHEEKLYDVFVPSDEEIAQAKTRGKHA